MGEREFYLVREKDGGRFVIERNDEIWIGIRHMKAKAFSGIGEAQAAKKYAMELVGTTFIIEHHTIRVVE